MAHPAARLIGTSDDGLAVSVGRLAVRQGQPCSGVSMVTHGAFLESAVDEEGRVLGLDVLGPGDPIGGVVGTLAVADVRAIRPSRVCEVTPDRVGWLLDGRRQRSAEFARQLAWLGVGERVALRLDDLAERFGRASPGGTLVRLPITQDDLAALCGASRESVNRALGALRREGRVRSMGRGRFLVPGLHPVPDDPSCSRTRLQEPQ